MREYLKQKIKRLIALFFRLIGPKSKRLSIANIKQLNILVVGVVLSDRKNYFSHIVECFNNSTHNVTQSWVSLFGNLECSCPNVSILNFDKPTARNKLLNTLISQFNLSDFDYIVVCDDDIKLSKNFLDNYMYIQSKLDFCLAQPARTIFSYISHPITKRNSQLFARETRFVEIGPLFSVHKDIFKYVFPLDEAAAMGWGLDYVWPELVKALNKKMGIIDATPVDHSLRDTANSYSKDIAQNEMVEYLQKNEHIDFDLTRIIVHEHHSIS